MTRTRWQLVAAVVPLLLWLPSLVDALRFHADARDYLASTGCLDAANDLSYSRLLLTATGLGATLALLQTSVHLRRHRAMWSLGMLLVGGFGVAFHHSVLIGPIVFFPPGIEVALLWLAVGGLYAATLLAYGLARGLDSWRRGPRSQQRTGSAVADQDAEGAS